MQKENGTHVNLTERETKQLRKVLRVFTVILIVSGLAGIWVGVYKRFNPDLPFAQASKAAKDPMRVISHVRVNGVDLWIPVPYFKAGHVPAEPIKRDLLLLTLWPEFEPLKERPQKLWDKGEWYRHVMILLMDRTGRNDLNGMYEFTRRQFHATAHVGNAFGLEIYTEPTEDTWRDLYLEKDGQKLLSFIVCDEDTGRNPQCTHWIWDEHFAYHISYDKDLLSHWRDIKDKTLALFDSFARVPSPESSTNNNPKGD